MTTSSIRRTQLLVIAGCVALAGCSLALDPSRHQGGGVDASPGTDGGPRDGGGDPDEDGGGDPEDGGGDPEDGGPGDAGPPCAGDLTCEPAAPAGWNGPVVLLTGPGDAAAPACPGTAPATAFTARTGLSAPPATCDCACTPPPEAAMACGSANLTTTGNSMCITIATTHATLADGECRSIPNLPSTGRWSVTRPPFSSSMGCTPAPTTAVPPLTWAESHRGCGFGTPTPCGDALVCVPPRAAGERVCVYVDGDAACPPAFPEQLATAEDATDTRGCGACTCGGITGTCDGFIHITNGCPGTLLRDSVDVNECHPASSLPTPMFASAGYTPMGSCPPSTPAPTGAATPTVPRTVCCTTE